MAISSVWCSKRCVKKMKLCRSLSITATENLDLEQTECVLWNPAVSLDKVTVHTSIVTTSIRTCSILGINQMKTMVIRARRAVIRRSCGRKIAKYLQYNKQHMTSCVLRWLSRYVVVRIVYQKTDSHIWKILFGNISNSTVTRRQWRHTYLSTATTPSVFTDAPTTTPCRYGIALHSSEPNHHSERASSVRHCL